MAVTPRRSRPARHPSRASEAAPPRPETPRRDPSRRDARDPGRLPGRPPGRQGSLRNPHLALRLRIRRAGGAPLAVHGGRFATGHADRRDRQAPGNRGEPEGSGPGVLGTAVLATGDDAPGAPRVGWPHAAEPAATAANRGRAIEACRWPATTAA